ncbi:unnamed protein product [Closterium sp. NIES-64]|nr:unnamed protein product [Closterium sp. NIES-64]
MVISGLSGLIAGACSMAIGEYISVYGQRDSEEADLKREQEEFEKGPEAVARELRELTQIYVSRGVPHDLARQVAEALHESDPIRAHAREELGIDLDDLSDPGQAAMVSAVSFFLGGILPLLSGCFITDYKARITVLFGLSTTLFVFLGAIGAWLGGAPRARAALRTTVGGWLAMAITYSVVWAFAEIPGMVLTLDLWVLEAESRESMYGRGVWAWCMGVVCGRGVWAWCVGVVCGRGVWAWCMGVVCGRGVWAWCVGVVYGRGVWAWCVGVVYGRGVWAWCMGVVYGRGVWAWCMGVVCGRGVWAWCVGVVYGRGVWA